MRSLRALVDRLLLRAIRAASASGATERGTEPVLDLHGFGVKDALAATARFLAEAHAAAVPEVRIVYGKGRHSVDGRGVLREVVPRWLDGDGRAWVESATPETDIRGEDAVIRVRLRRPEPGPRLTADTSDQRD